MEEIIEEGKKVFLDYIDLGLGLFEFRVIEFLKFLIILSDISVFIVIDSFYRTLFLSSFLLFIEE